VPSDEPDEIGQLAETFNQTIVRLRSQVQTEAERDRSAGAAGAATQHHALFFTRSRRSPPAPDQRGEVTADVLATSWMPST